MPWVVRFRDSESPVFPAEWQAEQYLLQTERSGRIVDLTPDPNLRFAMLEPNVVADRWKEIARYVSLTCDTLRVHWWHSALGQGSTSLFDVLGGLARPMENGVGLLPTLTDLNLGVLARHVDDVSTSWTCPGGVAVKGKVSAEAVHLILDRSNLAWWDFHLFRAGRRIFTATDGGSEFFVSLSEHDLRELTKVGLDSRFFRFFERQ